jgi:hypothetical protein
MGIWVPFWARFNREDFTKESSNGTKVSQIANLILSLEFIIFVKKRS